MKQVIIVDDEPELLLSIQAGLEKNNGCFQIMTAENGREALDLLENNVVDLVVTDLRMPEMDGVELLAAMSESFPEVPSIVMTAFGTSSMERLLKKTGTLNFLEKPLDIDSLEQAVTNALDFYHNREGGLELDIFLQLVAMERKTVHLKVVDPDRRQGSFFFRKGFLIDAEQDDRIGDEAVLAMLEWKHVQLSMKEFIPPVVPEAPEVPKARPHTETRSEQLLLRSGMPYCRERQKACNPLYDEVRQEFIQAGVYASEKKYELSARNSRTAYRIESDP
ncbi:MAG: response regulator [Candidatus Electrothrix sp. YB6]